MSSKTIIKDLPFLIVSFFIPFLLFYFTKSHSLMFDDAAEFALVIKLGSIAHPPGSPSYIMAGMLWNNLTSLFGLNIVDSLTLLAATCISGCSLIMFFIFKIISKKLSVIENTKSLIVSSICAIAFSTASTSWAWGNTIEVYSFQAFAMAITLFGLINYHFNRKKFSIFIAALGIAAGLGNHHLTMILFLPFTPLFFLKNFFGQDVKTETKKKMNKNEQGFLNDIKFIFKNPDFWILTSMTLIFTILFYSWMFLRAQNDYPFMFGKPETLSELFYHVSGGSYSKNISSTSEKVISSRIPYFLKLTALQLFVFIPFYLLGILTLIKKKLYPLFWTTILYYLFLFFYQLNNNQWSSTDAYMLLPFLVMTIPVFYGVIYSKNKIKVEYILPIILAIQITYNFHLHDRRSYPVSDSLMNLLDKSAPLNSIVIVSDWSTIIQYYYYRIAENFRPDLIVLNYDFKFTHFKILPTLYPEFYKIIKPEYDQYIKQLTIEHPHQAVNTGCDLTSPALVSSFITLLHKMETIAKSQNKYFLTDPRAHYFYSSNNYYEPKRFVSGCFSSSKAGETKANDNFLKLDFPFLKSDLLYTDPAALDKLVDFQAMLDRYTEYYSSVKDSIRQSQTLLAHAQIIKYQRKMKKSMSFAYQK